DNALFPLRPLQRLLEQSGILDGYRDLVRQGFQHGDVIFAESVLAGVVDVQGADDPIADL
nr:hypothetical protein [Desulfuromonadales bacterium]